MEQKTIHQTQEKKKESLKHNNNYQGHPEGEGHGKDLTECLCLNETYWTDDKD